MRAGLRRHITTLSVIAMIATGCVWGCDESSTSPISQSGGLATREAVVDYEAINRSPSATVRLVHQYRLDGKLSMVAPFLQPQQRTAVLELIRAADSLDYANQSLQSTTKRRLGRSVALTVDHPEIVNVIGVFSKDVRVVSELVNGDKAIVTIQIADRLPLSKIGMVRWNDRWVIKTDPPIDGLADELAKLAELWFATAKRIDELRLPADSLQEELEARQAPIFRRIKALLESAEHP